MNVPADRPATEEAKEIPLSLLAPDPMNIREAPRIDEEFLASVGKGVIQPLVVRPVGSIQDRGARKKLEEGGKQYAVTAGVRRYAAAVQLKLKAVPCVVKEMGDLEARCLSIAENRHRKDIPEWRWAEVIRDLYDRLEGSKMERYRKIHELTGMGESTVSEYLLLSGLPEDFRSRLKEPGERSVSEKEALKRSSLAKSEKKAPFGERSEEKAPLEEVSKKDLEEPPRVPMKVMVQMVRDDDFRKLMKTEPAKAHALLTEAAKKGQKRVGEVLRLAREWKTKPREPIERAVKGVDYVDLDLGTVRLIGADFVRALEIYRQEKGLEDLPSAAKAVLYEWIVEQTSIKYADFPTALAGAMLKYLTLWRYTDKASELLKKEREEVKK